MIRFLLKKLTDEELIDEYVLHKNNNAFDEIFKRYFEITYRFVYARTNNTTITEDIVSDTFISLLELLSTFRKESQLKSFIIGIAINKIRHTWRDKVRLNETFTYDEEHFTSKENLELCEVHSLPYNLDIIMQKLPLNYREVLELRYIQQKSFEEIANNLKLTPNNTRVLCHRALKKAASIGNTVNNLY